MGNTGTDWAYPSAHLVSLDGFCPLSKADYMTICLSWTLIAANSHASMCGFPSFGLGPPSFGLGPRAHSPWGPVQLTHQMGESRYTMVTAMVAAVETAMVTAWLCEIQLKTLQSHESSPPCSNL